MGEEVEVEECKSEAEVGYKSKGEVECKLE